MGIIHPEIMKLHGLNFPGSYMELDIEAITDLN